ncbi:MAG: SDR family oxidoreductase [Desulfobacula sp.]|nr:SDR family oxidoreductase [Desulfobacula sp.]
MSTEHLNSIIGFVWRPEEITPEVIQMARQTGSSAIFDFSGVEGTDGLSFCLRETDPAGLARDIKICASALMDPSLGRVLKETGVHNLWVECPLGFSQEDTSLFLKKLGEISKNYGCFPITGDTDLVEKILKEDSGIGRIVLKGCEAAGFVSRETTMTLYSMAKAMLRSSLTPFDILIWGGVFVPEAAAAFLSTGAAGIIFESVHWLTDRVAVEDSQRERLCRLRPDSTDLVGLDVQVPCRLFNKGNSLAFKDIQAYEDSLSGTTVVEENRKSFVNRVNAGTVHPLKSLFSRDEIIPLGVEAAFAEAFLNRFGAGTGAAVNAFTEKIHHLCSLAEEKKNCFSNSPVAKEMGTLYPFIQGAMSWITDVPEFALRVADAGGLPTIALGMMDSEALDQKLGRLPDIMGAHPYAVNMVALAENPFRGLHLAWIKKHRPRFAVIAGGDLSAVRELMECGIDVMYIAPDEALLTLALKAGVRYVICEGYEAGGHVGPHSTLTLAQMVLDLKQRTPSLFQNCRIILAGGIFNRETAFMAAMLGADAIQMGTAYLATQEIVETGALVPLYQQMILKSPLAGTVVSGRNTGLRVRSLRTPRMESILSLEREFAAGRRDEASFRERMEKMAAGSLFTAARGMDGPGEIFLDEQTCLERGQFMSGACAGLIRSVDNLESFHRELAQGPLFMHQPVVRPMETPLKIPASGVKNTLKRVYPKQEHRERIAITGMSIVNTLGKSPEEIWAASLTMKSGITGVPPSRWDHALYYDPRPHMPDKTYCRVGAFLDFPIDRNELGIPPHDFRSMTEATRISMWLADRAIRASGILTSDIPRERIAVLISQNSGEAAGTLPNIIIRAYVHEILANVKKAVDLTPGQQNAIEQEIKSGRMAPDDTTLLGRLNCAAAGFICKQYGFMGPSHAVSAACATSLVALHSAIQMIRNGIIDAAVVGGGEDTLSHLHFLEFSALDALYGLSGRERPSQETSCPFDAQRDGMVLGEGGAMIVIERESLARARGALVHAFVTGMGASNNHLGMVESSNVSQQMAIRASFRETSYGPDAVDLVECHATSTRQGDLEEVRALKAFFHSSRRTVLTAFKSQIGHTLGASGISSLIRGVTAMKAGIFPPTLNYRHPDPEINPEKSGLIISPEPLDWKSRASEPRRLEVNAFGFGGSNYVVQVEQAMDEMDTVMVSTQKAAAVHQNMKVVPPLALVFPGQGAQYGGMGQELYASFPIIKEWMDRAAAVADFDLLHLMFHDQEENLQKTRWQQPAMFAMEHAVARYLISLGIRPVAMAGHSLGELTALCLAGVYSFEDGFRIVNKRALCMDKAAAANIDPGVMAATDVPLDLLKKMIQDYKDIHIGNINSPRQIVLSGNTGAIRDFCQKLKEMGHRTTLLRVSMAFHSPAMQVIHDELAAYIADIPFHPPQIPVISNTTRIPYPSDPDEIKKILMAHLESTVHWMDNAQSLWNTYGVRLFVEVGPGDVLSNLIADTLPGSSCIQTCLRSSESSTFKDALAQLSAQGHLKEEGGSKGVFLPALKKAPESLRIVPALALRQQEPGHANPMGQIIQREINRFVMENSGQFLKSNILEAIRRELNPKFKEGELSIVIKSMFGGFEPPEFRTPVAPGSVEPPGSEDLMERLIQIIMDATGFNRDEIQPDMDLRKDLSIRSSRLPIIMDAAERQFGITIELEDFIDVRTVKDIAKGISKLTAGQNAGGLYPASEALDQNPVQDKHLKSSKDEASLKRLVFEQATVEFENAVPMELVPGETVLFLSPDGCETIAAITGEILKADYGINPFPMGFIQKSFDPGKVSYDIRTKEGALRAVDKIAGLSPVSGMVITLGRGGPVKLSSITGVSQLLKGFFLLLKAFLESPAKKFIVLIHSAEDIETPVGLLAEGILGLFLSAAQEYPSVQFRTLEIERDTGLRNAVRNALDKECAVVEMIHRDGKVISPEGRLSPSVFRDSSSLNLCPGDVVVIAGGAAGIGSHLARCLAPFMPRLILLGRTLLDPGADPAKPFAEHPSSGAATIDSRALEIARTLADLHASGIEADYHTCDITDPEAVQTCLEEVIRRYGKIDGIIHSAGILKDGPLSRMTLDDFSMVTDVKFLGAWNLFLFAKNAGLKFFAGLSSAAAIQGNPGQANYAAANRMMSALLRHLSRENSAIRFKALMLPPVEGAGMADDPRIQALLKQKGVAYIHVNELAGLVCRELFLSPAEDHWVMFMKKLPSVRTVLLDDRTRPSSGGDLDSGLLSFKPGDFPMIEKILYLDLCREELEAYRSFFLEKDLWITDHRPFKFIKHPIVSATMVLETFMEAARILYPHLQVRGVRKVRLMDMIECRPGVPRPARISCRRAGDSLREVLCETSLSAQEISPTGRLTEHFALQCNGQVILDGGGETLKEGFLDFPIRPDELRTRPMNRKKVLKWYKDRSGLGGRYRVIEFLDGTGPGVIRGRTIYPETCDFANLQNVKYQYSPYLFEALLQLVCCHIAVTDPSEPRSMIPLEIGEMRCFRKVRVGEKITLEARLRAQDDKILTWDTRGLDDQGETLMQIFGLQMKWISD